MQSKQGNGLDCTLDHLRWSHYIRSQTGQEHSPDLCNVFAVVGLQNRKWSNMCPKTPIRSIGLKIYIIFNTISFSSLKLTTISCVAISWLTCRSRAISLCTCPLSILRATRSSTRAPLSPFVPNRQNPLHFASGVAGYSVGFYSKFPVRGVCRTFDVARRSIPPQNVRRCQWFGVQKPPLCPFAIPKIVEAQFEFEVRSIFWFRYPIKHFAKENVFSAGCTSLRS